MLDLILPNLIPKQALTYFDSAPMVVFPDVNNTNNQGLYVGYGDSLPNHPDTIYGVAPSGTYDGYMPIHIKRSRSHMILSSQNLTVDGKNIPGLIASHWTQDGINCVEQIINSNVVPQNFLPAGKKLVNFDKSSAEWRSCINSGSGIVSIVNEVGPAAVSDATEDCSNGIDDDEDGLIDGDDPDCQTAPVEEICSNGIDDDGDGLIDGDDPNCLTCPQSAQYFRDCEEDFNSLTGLRFRSVNWYLDVYNTALPGVDNNINVRFDIFVLVNNPACSTNCPIGNSEQTTSNPAISIFSNPEITSVAHFDIDDDFEAFYSPDLNSGLN